LYAFNYGGLILSSLSIQRDYFRKRLLFVSLIALVVIGVVGGCSDNNGEQNSTQVLTENDFANDDSLSGNPEGLVIVTFLEHPNMENAENDTHELGIDEIPITYSRTIEHTLCWEDEDEQSGHFMELKDSEGNEVLRLDANGECVTEVIEAGDYAMIFYHDGRLETKHAIFIIPNPEDVEQAKNTRGLINRFKTAAANIVERIEQTVTKDAEAQVVERHVELLISTNSCPACELAGADLSGADLTGAILILANMTGANLMEANLMDADIRVATLVNANLSSANLSEADFSSSDLTGANMSGANLEFARLDEANLENATLADADLENADLEMAILVNTNLRNAVLVSADLRGADLSSADLMDADMLFVNLFFANLSNTNLGNANLHFAYMPGANLMDANLAFADLTDATLLEVNLIGAILFGADFSDALWCDACACDNPSVGTCVGCPSAEEVCTGPE